MAEGSAICHDPLECLDKQTFLQRLCRQGRGGRFPLAGQWEITYRCNLKCIMCYTDPFNTPERIRQELTRQEIFRILDELAQAGCLFLALTGGEPTARPDFPAIYQYAKAKGLLLTIFTNGTLITPKLLDLWTELPPRMIEISLHGITPETFEEIMQGKSSGTYARVMRAIALLLERKLPLTLKTTGMTVNEEQILRIKAFVDRLRTVHYRFGSDMRPRLDGSEDTFRYQLPEEVVREIERADPALRAERTRQDRLRLESQRKGEPRCGSWRYRFHIDAYGQLQLCSSNRRKSYDLRHGSFEEGFYRYLPEFPCPNRATETVPLREEIHA